MDQKKRCGWCEGSQLYRKYHDQEWGVPLYNDRQLFEFLILETFQAGLSWITILKKRENFRRAFDQFNYVKISQYSEGKIQELLRDPGIIRNQQKIRAAVANSQAFMKIKEEFTSFSNYIWAFVDHKPIQNKFLDYQKAPAKTDLSIAISKDLKRRGFKFVGPTVVYAHMQATGMVNDHEVDCFRYEEIQNLS